MTAHGRGEVVPVAQGFIHYLLAADADVLAGLVDHHGGCAEEFCQLGEIGL